MASDAADRNFLFGVLALHAGLLDPAQFAEAGGTRNERRPGKVFELV
jgi:hypothetical protein